MRSIKGKVVAITGAGSGIGKATAELLAQKGAHLGLSDINEFALMDTKMRVEAEGARCHTTVLDVADREAVYAWADRVHEEFKHINVIINNAGVSLGAVVEDTRYEDFEWLMNINFWGVVYGTKAFLPYLRKSGDGHVVNISSLFGLVAMPAASAYNASKFAVRGFTEALAEELKTEGAPVEVTSVHPGGVNTAIARDGRITKNTDWGLDSADKFAKNFRKIARTPPEAAAQDILKAIECQKPRLLIGKDAKVIDIAQRIMPVKYQSLVMQLAKRTLFGMNQS